MSGSNKPRPALGRDERTGRPLSYEKQYGYDAPTTVELLPYPTAVRVEGQSEPVVWTPQKRTKFNELIRLCDFFGIVALEVELERLDAPRMSWARKRIDLWYAEATIIDIPGIRFDEWAKLYLAGLPESPVALAAARKKATVALHRLYSSGKVVKRYDPNGHLILFVPKAAPPLPATWRPSETPPAPPTPLPEKVPAPS